MSPASAAASAPTPNHSSTKPGVNTSAIIRITPSTVQIIHVHETSISLFRIADCGMRIEREEGGRQKAEGSKDKTCFLCGLLPTAYCLLFFLVRIQLHTLNIFFKTNQMFAERSASRRMKQ